MTIVIAFLIMSPPALHTRLIYLRRVLYLQSFIVFWRTVRIAEEIFHSCYTRELPCEQFRGQSCPNNFSVDSRVAFSLMEVAEGVFIIT